MVAFYPIHRELDHIQQAMNDILHNSILHHRQYLEKDIPPVNLTEKSDELIEVQLPIPGNDPKSLEITYEKGHLAIQGNRLADIPEKAKVIRQERDYGAFHRLVELPFRINPDSISALYQDGILTVQAQRAEEDKPRKIQIS